MGKLAHIIPVSDLKQDADKEILRLLARGEQEIEAGEGFDLDAVLQEADRLLAEDQP